MRLRRFGRACFARESVKYLQMLNGCPAPRPPGLTQALLHHSKTQTSKWGGRPVSDDDRKTQLDDLGARIAAAKAGPDRKPHQEEHYSQAQMGWRMVTELVAGLGIGFGIGYGLDSLLGTLPWLMVLFTFLGLAAGINVMMRTAQEFQAKTPGGKPGQDEREQNGD